MELQPTRGKRAKEDMFDLIGNRDASNLTIKEFCKQHGLTQAMFYYWQKKYHTENSDPVNPGGFVRLQVEDPQHTAAHQGLFAEVRGIKLYQSVPATYLKELLSDVYVKP